MRPRACFLATLLAALLVARDGAAQCGAKHSTCSACHDGVRAPAPSHAAWHEDHAFADLCPVCHGGSGEEADEATSHVGLARPLDDAADQCNSCHGASTQAFLSRYRAEVLQTDAGGAARAAVTKGPPPPSSTSPIRDTRRHGDPGRNIAMSVVVIAVGAISVFHVLRRERLRGARDA